MSLDHDDRTLLGLVVAPIATVPILSLLGGTRLLGALSVPELVRGMLHASFFYALYGLPIAYAVEALLVFALRAAGRSPRTLPGIAVIALGASAGLLLFGLLGLDSLREWVELAGEGALMGGGASVLFVLIRGRAADPRAVG